MIEDEKAASGSESDLPSRDMSSQATGDQVLTFDDFEDTNDSGFLSESSSGPDSDSGSSTDRESGSGTKPEPGADNPPFSKDELLVYLENMRQRFSTRPTSDSFADQDEEVLIVSSKKRLVLTQHLNAPQLMCLPGIYQN